MLFLWYRHGRRSLIFFFFTQRPFLTSVVFLSLHDTLLTTRGRRGLIVFVFSCFCCDGPKCWRFCWHTRRRFGSTHGGFQRATPYTLPHTPTHTRHHHTHTLTHTHTTHEHTPTRHRTEVTSTQCTVQEHWYRHHCLCRRHHSVFQEAGQKVGFFPFVPRGPPALRGQWPLTFRISLRLPGRVVRARRISTCGSVRALCMRSALLLTWQFQHHLLGPHEQVEEPCVR